MQYIIEDGMMKNKILLRDNDTKGDVIDVQRILLKKYQEAIEEMKKRYFDAEPEFKYDPDSIT